ncbi:hypothetical protein BEP68_14355 [Microbacterium sp. 4-7]|nr:hypothetical protein [Microbacterium sp. 4-7]
MIAIESTDCLRATQEDGYSMRPTRGTHEQFAAERTIARQAFSNFLEHRFQHSDSPINIRLVVSALCRATEFTAGDFEERRDTTTIVRIDEPFEEG